MSRRRLVATVAVLATASVMAGCGDGSTAATTVPSTAVPPTGASPTASPSTSTAVTAPPTATGGGPTMVTSAPVPIGSGGATTAALATSATRPATTTAPGPSAVPGTSGGATPSTTTAGGPLVLRANGIGPVLFGTDPDTVITAVTGELGAPTRDSGWTDPLSLGSCPGTQVRTVQYGDVWLYFGDESTVVTGRPHFFAYSYGPASAGAPRAVSPTIEGGGTIGTTVAELRTAHPAVELFPADPTAPASFAISDGLTGQLTGITDTDTVTRVQGGIGCGE